jgi:hypothetical protein
MCSKIHIESQTDDKRKGKIIMKHIEQKIAGIFLALASIPVIHFENDATVAALFIPLGLYLIFTKKKVMY